MNLYRISQTSITFVNSFGFFDCAVVAAESEDEARWTHPHKIGPFFDFGTDTWSITSPEGTCSEPWNHGDWPSPSEVSVTLIGTAAPGIEAGVIVASYNPE